MWRKLVNYVADQNQRAPNVKFEQHNGISRPPFNRGGRITISGFTGEPESGAIADGFILSDSQFL